RRPLSATRTLCHLAKIRAPPPSQCISRAVLHGVVSEGSLVHRGTSEGRRSARFLCHVRGSRSGQRQADRYSSRQDRTVGLPRPRAHLRGTEWATSWCVAVALAACLQRPCSPRRGTR